MATFCCVKQTMAGSDEELQLLIQVIKTLLINPTCGVVWNLGFANCIVIEKARSLGESKTIPRRTQTDGNA